MNRIAPFAGTVALLLAFAPSASAQPPPSPEPGPPDCADWKSGEFSLFFRNAGVGAVGSCLRDGADANARSDGDRTPLHSALVETGDLGVVIALLEGGADVNARDWGGSTPLHIAAGSPGKLAFVTTLIEAGADVNARDADDRTPLHSAIRNPAAARTLLASGADPLARDLRGRIADPSHCEHWNSRTLAAAATADAVARCIEAGADVHARLRTYTFGRDDEGNTPLHHAAMYDNGDNVALLLEAGADVDVRNDRDATPLVWATAHGRTAVAAILLDWGADVNAHDDRNRTALHQAVRRGDIEAVALLLETGANVHARDDEGATPLIWRSRPAVLDLLIGAGADVGARNSSGSTALRVVASAPDAPGALRIANRLLESGADPNAYDDRGRTPLILAARGDTTLSSAPCSKPERMCRRGCAGVSPLGFGWVVDSSGGRAGCSAVGPLFMRRPRPAPTPACRQRCSMPGRTWQRETSAGEPLFTCQWRPAGVPLWFKSCSRLERTRTLGTTPV